MDCQHFFFNPLGRFQATPKLQVMEALESLLPTPYLDISIPHATLICNRQITQNNTKNLVILHKNFGKITGKNLFKFPLDKMCGGVV